MCSISPSAFPVLGTNSALVSHHEWNDNIGEDKVLRDPWARCILVQCVLSEHILAPSIIAYFTILKESRGSLHSMSL